MLLTVMVFEKIVSYDFLFLYRRWEIVMNTENFYGAGWSILWHRLLRRTLMRSVFHSGV